MKENENKESTEVGREFHKSLFPLVATHVWVSGDYLSSKDNSKHDGPCGLMYSRGGKEYVENADGEGNYDFVPTFGNPGELRVSGIVKRIDYSNEKECYGESPTKYSLSLQDFRKFESPESLRVTIEKKFYAE